MNTQDRQEKPVHKPREDIYISDAVNADPRPGEPLAVLEPYLEDSVEAFGLV